MTIRILLASLSFLILFGIVELIYYKFHISKELSRKLVHIFSAIIISVLPFWLSYYEIAVVAGLFVPVLYFSKRYNIFKAIHTVERSTLGEVYYPLAIVIVCLLKPSFFSYLFVVLTLGLSDGLAAVIGKHYGNKQFSILNSHKSYLGSAIFFISTATLGSTLLILFGLANIVNVFSIVLISIILTIIEASSSKGLDNLLIPLVGLFLLRIAGLF
ncbi:MAG: hypothetical protein WCK71_01905 [bacterium]